MDIISKNKSKIEELNQRFNLILENYVDIRVRNLQNQQNTTAKYELDHIKSVITQLDSDGFVLQNSMDSAIHVSQQSVKEENTIIDKLKIENVKLKEQASRLKTNTVTSEGLFDEELDWYKIQLNLLIIMIIGFILCGKFYYDLQLTKPDHMVVIGGTALLGVVGFIFLFIYNRVITNSTTKVE